MTKNLQALSDADSRAVFNRRLANWFGVIAAGLFAAALRAGAASMQPYVRATAGV